MLSGGYRKGTLTLKSLKTGDLEKQTWKYFYPLVIE